MNMIFVSDIFLVSIAFIWLVAASITDIKKREVFNWLSFSLIAIAFSIRALAAVIERQPQYFLYAIVAFAIFFLIANLFYYSRTFGGADAKLLMALAPLLATAPFFAKQNIINGINEPFLLGFIINIFFIGAVYSLGFGIIFAIKNKKKFSREFRKINKKTAMFSIFLWFLAIIFLIMGFFSRVFFILSAVFFILPAIYVFIKAVENLSMIQKILTTKVTEGDWLVKPIKIKNKIIRPSVHGLDKKDIALLKKYKKQITIKSGLPFVPIFVLALISSLFIGDFLLLIIKSMIGVI